MGTCRRRPGSLGRGVPRFAGPGHKLFQSHRTGAVVDPATRFAFPARWHYDILRALDYFRDADAERDPPLEEVVAIVRKRQPLEHLARAAGSRLVEHHLTGVLRSAD